jgi:alpha-tubulin suppressor-like RCC1 family protein
MVLGGAASPTLAEPTSPGQLYAFGDNEFGELGITTNFGTSNANPTPTLISLPGASGPVTQIAAGGDHSLAVTSTGQLYAFGYNRYGQLGITTNSGTSNANPTPTLVSLPGASGPVTQIAAGEDHSLAVTSTGQLYAFGYNQYGQLGITTNSGTGNENPTPTLVSLPGASGPVIQIAAGNWHSLALTSTGQLYTFGRNASGELGRATNSGTGNANPTPALVSLPGASGPVTQIAGGGAHSLAVTSTGQLYAFGYNQYGQLGITTNSGTGNENPTPTLVSLPGASGPVTQIAAGGDHSLAVTSTGQLYAFGYNQYGQLGIATNSGTSNANPTPTLVSLPGASGPVTQIAAGRASSLAVTSTGQLYAFGENLYGQLGVATNSGTPTASPTPALVALPAGTTIDTVARGPSISSLALVADLAASTASLPAGELGVPYSAAVQARGGTPPYTWTVSGLPAGLTANPANGQITGTPTSAGGANVTLTVTDAYGISASSTVIPLTIVPDIPLTVVPDNGGTLAPAALAPVPDAVLASTALAASSSGALNVEVSCPFGESRCAGIVTLRTLGAVSTSTTGHQSKKHKAAILTLAVGSFNVAGGHVTTVKLHLSAKARTLLTRTHMLHALATIVAHDPSGASHTTQTTVAIRLVKASHRRKT